MSILYWFRLDFGYLCVDFMTLLHRRTWVSPLAATLSEASNASKLTMLYQSPSPFFRLREPAAEQQ